MRFSWGSLLVTTLAIAAGCADPPVQPIAFNHQLHVTRGALECESCHETVYEETFAGLPPLKICMRCHRSDTPKDPAVASRIEVVRSYEKNGSEVAWQRVYQMPPFVFFSHRRHTEVAGLECEVCHGKMAEMTAPPEHPASDILTMSGCVHCHEQKHVSTDCAACHR